MNRGHRHGAGSGCLGTMEVKSKVRGPARPGRGGAARWGLQGPGPGAAGAAEELPGGPARCGRWWDLEAGDGG